MTDELVDVIDPATGEAVATLSRQQVRATNAWHRSVFVVVVRGDGGVVTHRRAAWKDVWPSRWDFTFGGVVTAGEPSAAAAARELAEEAGIHGVELEHLGAASYADEVVREVGDVFVARWDGPIDPADGEVVAVDEVPATGLRAWLDEQEVVPDSAVIALDPFEAWCRAVGLGTGAPGGSAP